jgi:hypothetical protein
MQIGWYSKLHQEIIISLKSGITSYDYAINDGKCIYFLAFFVFIRYFI